MSPFQRPDSPSVDTHLIEPPTHGTLSALNAADGSYTYQPSPGFVGRDYFTYRVLDGSKAGGYATVFIDVQPVAVSLSINSLRPGDPGALIPAPDPAASTPPYATLNLSYPGLPYGSTVTLSVNSGAGQDLNVSSDAPGSPDAAALIGKDAGTNSVTWTIGGSDAPPSRVYVTGLIGTGYDQVTFTLTATVAPTIIGSPTAPAPAPGQAGPATQPATVPGKGGYLVAFDGTMDYPNNPIRGGDFNGSTAIVKLRDDYRGTTFDYHRGVANVVDHPLGINPLTWPNLLAIGFHGAFGSVEANGMVGDALDKLQTFYQDPAHRGIPVDLIGYSRGAFEAVKLANLLASAGLPDKSAESKRTVVPVDSRGRPDIQHRYVVYTKQLPSVAVRFVGLVSPVNQMGPFTDWPSSLPSGVKSVYQALDNKPESVLFPQTTITTAAGTDSSGASFLDYNHPTIGVVWDVLDDLEAHARAGGVPLR